MIDLVVSVGLLVLGGAIVLGFSLPGRPRPPRVGRSRRPRPRTIAAVPATLPPRDEPVLAPDFEVAPAESASARVARFALGIAVLALALAVGILAVVRGIALLVDRLVRF